MYKYILIIIFFFKIGFASNFSLDQFEIEINSNFLGKEVVLFGNKDKDSDLIFIFEGENKKAKLTTKVKEGFLWINETKELNNQPSFFAIFTYPKKTLNEIFLYSIIPSRLSSVSIIAENLFTFLTIAKYQLIDFSNLNFSRFLFQFLFKTLFDKTPLQPFLLSYAINPSLKEEVAFL